MLSHLFNTRMKLPINEYPSIQVLLRAVAQVLVLFQHLLVEVVDEVELVVLCIVVAIDLVLHFGLCCRDGNQALDIEEDRPFVSG